MRFANPVNLPRVFIIDNDITDCQSMCKSLFSAGYEAAFSTDVQESLTSLLQNPPHCLIINAILPKVSGYAICRQVRTIYSYNVLPIIVMSTSNTALDQNYSFKMGGNYYLPKPFGEDALLKAVQKMLPAFSPTAATTKTSPSPVSQIIAPKTSREIAVPTLMPYRRDEGDIMLQNNPFARTFAVIDVPLQSLYNLIDGRKNIQKLAEIMQLDLQSTLKLLKTLWKQQRIMFYDEKKRSVKDVSFFDSIN